MHIPPNPLFMARKVKNLEDHWLKEDWLAHFHVAEDDKIDRFKNPFLVDLGDGFISTLILVILMEIILLL